MARDDENEGEVQPARKPRPAGNPLARTIFFWVGVLLVVASPLVGAIPGPGGVFVFAAGAGLMLRNSKWAKKLYVRFKRRHPKKGEWTDWSLRRQSHFRRAERQKIVVTETVTTQTVTAGIGRIETVTVDVVRVKVCLAKPGEHGFAVDPHAGRLPGHRR